MSQLVLVRGQQPRYLFNARLILPFCFAFAVVTMMFDDPALGLQLTAVFGPVWAVVEVYAAYLRTKRAWLCDTGDGFDLIDRAGKIHFADVSITSVAIDRNRTFRLGKLRRTVRKCTLWLGDANEPVTLETTVKGKRPDPSGEVTSRIWNRMREQAEATLQTGGRITGDGWQLDDKYFCWGADESRQSLRRDLIPACAEIGREVCIWRMGTTEPVVKLPAAGRNACLLPALLQPKPVMAREPDDWDGTALGRIVFQRRQDTGYRLLGYLGGAVLIIGGIGLLLNRESLGTMFLYCGIPSVIWAYWTGFSTFECHERGIRSEWILGSGELRYADVATFTYTATRHYRNGLYAGTRIGLHFKPLPKSRARRVNFCFTVMNQDEQMEALRDSISRTIAERMQLRLAAGETVTWTENLAFSGQSLFYRPAGLVGRKETQQVPFANISGCSFQDGECYLFRHDSDTSFMHESTFATNFFPGYFLFLKLIDDKVLDQAEN